VEGAPKPSRPVLASTACTASASSVAAPGTDSTGEGATSQGWMQRLARLESMHQAQMKRDEQVQITMTAHTQQLQQLDQGMNRMSAILERWEASIQGNPIPQGAAAQPAAAPVLDVSMEQDDVPATVDARKQSTVKKSNAKERAAAAAAPIPAGAVPAVPFK